MNKLITFTFLFACSLPIFSMEQNLRLEKKLSINDKQFLRTKLLQSFRSPEILLDNTDELVPDLEIPKDFDIIYVEQFAYAYGSKQLRLRTGFVSNCTVMTIYNKTTRRGALLHIAAENCIYLLEDLKGQHSYLEAHRLQGILWKLSNGVAANISVRLIGGCDGELSFWKSYLNAFDVRNINIHYFPGWMDPDGEIGNGEDILPKVNSKDDKEMSGMNDRLDYIKENNLSLGFIQFSCEDGSISVTQNPDQFYNHVFFAGMSPFRGAALVENDTLCMYYDGLKKTKENWFYEIFNNWPGQVFLYEPMNTNFAIFANPQ